MRILYFGNNWVGWQVLQWLKEQKENIVGVVLHPAHRQRYAQEILDVAQIGADSLFDASRLQERQVLEKIGRQKADVALSILFDDILPSEFLKLFPKGGLNLHPAYLPYNRGQYPNVWSIVERTPAGVTLHEMDAGVDTGKILAQRQVPVEPVDTGESLYRKLEHCSVELFKETWPLFCSGEIRSTSQKGTGTTHRREDVKRIDEIDLDRFYRARDLIDILRARTFPPYPGAYFVHNEERIYLRLTLVRESG